jgi:nucleoside-diphosphate-sugar epimerase
MRVMPEESPVFNVCTSRTVSIIEVAHAIAALCGVTAAIDFQPKRSGEALNSLGDPARAAAVLGFRATTTLATGLARMLGPTAAVTPPAGDGA